ncbi:MAG: response regulator [bacterium]|nr:MAG: response regulator [bacterium]
MERKRILIIEDDPDVRALTEDILRDRYEILLCEDGKRGIEVALRELPDLVLLDVYMGGITGFEVCRILKGTSETSSIPVIIFTVGAHKHEISRGYASGADDYITKPFEPEDLVDRIERLI